MSGCPSISALLKLVNKKAGAERHVGGEDQEAERQRHIHDSEKGEGRRERGGEAKTERESRMDVVLLLISTPSLS